MDLNETDFKKFKKWLTSILNLQEVTVTFTKKDGTERILKCTTCPDYVTYAKLEENKKEHKKNDEVCPVFDLESKSWRSFRWDSIKSVNFDLGKTHETS